MHAATAEADPMHTILIVEDDLALTRLMRFCLERERFTVRHAADGEEALLEFDAIPPADLVILDVMLPYRSGYDLLADLRTRPAWENVPVIMLSSCALEQSVVKGFSGGASDYISKPFRPAEMIARIRNLLRTAEKATR
jgi:two-component system, OmpR family, phosphate regulon response regulator PhoB